MKIRMKERIIVLAVCLSTLVSYSQQNVGISRLPNKVEFNELGSDYLAYNIKADIYLFPTYNNSAIVETTTNKKYSLSNINFNLYANSFDSKINNDSIYVFSFNRIKSIKINNKLFKKYLDKNTGKSKIYQVIYENNDKILLRDDKIVYSEIRDALNQSKPKISYNRVSNYYLKDIDNSISKFRLKKKSILSLFEDKQEMVAQFAKKNKISYGEEKDVKRLFNYYAKL